MAELPPEKQKILVLEATQVPSNWHLGMLRNDFARRLDALEDKVSKVPNLWVLSGARVDQRCWASEGLGRTVFSHYLIEALQGRAAGYDGRLEPGRASPLCLEAGAELGLEHTWCHSGACSLASGKRNSDRGENDGEPRGQEGHERHGVAPALQPGHPGDDRQQIRFGISGTVRSGTPRPGKLTVSSIP